VIPLLNPVKLTSGKLVNEIPIAKGQTMWINTPGYNRLPEIFGEDAGVFNVNRWLDDPTRDQRPQGATVGVFANLATFGHGSRACMGFRMGLWELQMFLITLLPDLEFTLPLNAPRICRSSSMIMTPTVEGQLAAGPQLPLDVAMIV